MPELPSPGDSCVPVDLETLAIASSEVATPAMQRYLMAIAAAERTSRASTMAIAQHVGCSGPSALEMLRRLGEAGFVDDGGTRRGTTWRLTASGRRETALIRRRQSVIESFMRSALGMGSVEAAHEAAQVAPWVSPVLECRLRDAVWPANRPCHTA